ncbi:MAG: TonB-dependent receptor plug domain-containing protein, partial [Candidatus Marinimicrobia bacterium]|nr:TonB-dependent receptor plug domain-containing protein [Candidatus Neomarinimicrobiota bacterium]
QGTDMGAATNQDGAFTIRNVPEGTYTVVVSYIGYDTKRLNNLQVQANSEITMDIKMTPSAIQGETVVVEEEASQSSETHLLLDRKESTNMTDGISAEQMSQTGVSDAEDALTRVTGVSVMGDNNVYIRGLGDRYNQTQMNGVPVPSPDPEKKTVPLDMFSTSLLESVTAIKTFTPDLPGVFAGGGVNIQTKAYPDNRVLDFNIGANYNMYAASDIRYRMVDEGEYDFWGYDNGLRTVPSAIPDTLMLSEFSTKFGPTRNARHAKLGEFGRQFKTGFQPKSASIGTPISFGLNFGDKFNPVENVEYGFFTNVKFSNGYDFTNRTDREYSLTGSDSLRVFKDMNVDRSDYNTNISASASTGITLFNDHKIKLHHVYTHGSETWNIITEGFADNIDDGLFFKQFYRERTLNNTTLSGSHDFIAFWQHQIDWSATTGSSELSEPDVNTINYRKKTQSDTTYFQMDPFQWSSGLREFTDGYDDNTNYDFNYEASFYDSENAEYKIKVGGRLRDKSREFGKRRFYHESSTNTFPQSVQRIDGMSEIGSGFGDNAYASVNEFGQFKDGIYILESTSESDGYSANEDLNAEYLMIDIPLGFTVFPVLNRVRFVGGVRREEYRLEMNPFNPVTKSPFTSSVLGEGESEIVQTSIDEVDYLPSYNLIIGTTENTNVRLSHSQTVARPQFREIAPFGFQNFYGDAMQVGFPFLKTTDIRNYDVRFEWFPQASELIATSIFYKDFTNPIETSIIQAADRSYRTPQNAVSASNRGIELELRKRLDFIPRDIGQFFVQLNTTFIRSEVVTADSVTMFNGTVVPNTATTTDRPLEGQSDFLLNGSITYNNLSGFTTTISYNTFSKRLRTLGTRGLPNAFEYPFHNMNLTAAKRIGSFKISLKVKNVLGSVHEIGLEDPSTGVLKFTEKYDPGRQIGLGIDYSL